MSEQAILHRAEEHGQSRQLEPKEVGSHTLMAVVESVALAGAAGLAVVVLQGLQGDVSLGTLGTAAATGGIVGGFSFMFHVSANYSQLRDGLRSYRSIETYAPPGSESQRQITSSPIVVNPLGGDPYVLDGDQRIALPDGRQSGLALNPPTLEAILREVIQQHDGQWSRRRLMSLRVKGQRVTRALYEEMTDKLCKAQFLQPCSRGGYSLPHDVVTPDDLQRYFPRLGGQEGRREGGNPSGNEAPTLAERRKRRWLECGCDVKLYRGKS